MVEKERVINDKDRDILKKAYYDEGMCFGRDGLYEYLKTQYDKPPSRRIVAAWLENQKLQQEYKGQRSGGTTDFFRPKAPFHSMSIDLIDFVNKPSQQYKYILVAIDNFSRKMYTESTTGKSPDKIAPAMEKVLQKLQSESGGKLPKFIISDDGSEFKGQFDTMLTNKYKIQRRRTLGGQPQQNGLVERANGKLKMLIAKNKRINGGTWRDNLERSVNAYNNQWNRMTKFNPDTALKLDKTQQQELIENVERKHKEVLLKQRTSENIFAVGDHVRLKLSKGKLDKQSDPSWTSTIYIVGKVINVGKAGAPTIATKYKIEGRAQDQLYSRNDLQLVTGTPEDIPVKPKTKIVRTQNKVAEATFTRIEEQHKVREEQRQRMKPKQFVFEDEGQSDKQRREYEVDKIVDKKKEGRRVLYKVRWKGYGVNDDTWQKLSDLGNAKTAVKAFELTQK